MRPSKASETKRIATELVAELMTVLREDVGLQLDLDQQLLLLTKLKSACERISANGTPERADRA